MKKKLSSLIAYVFVIVFFTVFFALVSWLYLTLAQDNPVLSFDTGKYVMAEDVSVVMYDDMTVFITEALDLEDLTVGGEVVTNVGGRELYNRITSMTQILLPCDVVAESYLNVASMWASSGIIYSFEVASGEKACAVALMIVDHRSPHVPWPEAPGLHGL